MKTVAHLFHTFALIPMITVSAWAADATGTWKWTLPPTGQTPVEVTLTLVARDEGLEGTYAETGKDPLPIVVQMTGDSLSFTVESPTLGKVQHIGRLEDDTINGLINRVERTGETGDPMVWKAERSRLAVRPGGVRPTEYVFQQRSNGYAMEHD